MFFHEERIAFPPALPISGNMKPSGCSPSKPSWPAHPLPGYMGCSFTYLSTFCVIVQEVQAVYLARDSTPLRERVSLAFAESMYRKLQVWANTLPKEMTKGDDSPAHMLIFQ